MENIDRKQAVCKMNPFYKIDVGTLDEVKQARAFADEVVRKMGYRPEWETITKQCISFSVLFLLYRFFVEKSGFPTVEDVRNFLLGNLVIEEKEGTDNGSIEDTDREPVYRVVPKGFADTLYSIANFEHVPEEGTEVLVWDDKEKEFDFWVLTKERLHILYPLDKDIYEASPYIHPWLYRNLLSLCESGDADRAASLAAAALERYIDNNPACRAVVYMEDENPFNPPLTKDVILRPDLKLRNPFKKFFTREDLSGTEE